MAIVLLILLGFSRCVFTGLNLGLATEVPVCEVHSKARNENAQNADQGIDKLAFGTGSIVVAFASIATTALTLFRLIAFDRTCLISTEEHSIWICRIVQVASHRTSR